MILLQVNCLNLKKEIYFYFTGFGTCYLHHYIEPVQQVRIFLEVVIIIMAVGFLVKVRVFSYHYSTIILFFANDFLSFQATREFRFLGRKIFMQNMVLCPSRVCFLISCILHQFTVPARILCFYNLDDALIQVQTTETQ